MMAVGLFFRSETLTATLASTRCIAGPFIDMEKDTDFDANFNTESLSRRSFFLKCAGPRYLARRASAERQPCSA
jgi:hypothetical protein